MAKRKYAYVEVFTRVRCMSDCHYWFSVALYTDGGNERVVREYQPEIGFAGLGNAFSWQAPQYVLDMVDSQIARMTRGNQFKVFECDRNGWERTEDLRYHDPQRFYELYSEH